MKLESQSKYMAGVNAALKSSSQTPQDAYIHTQDGRFYIDRPIWISNSMAHSMAQTARYRGNSDEFYSVAEHSVLVAGLMRHIVGGDPFEGLLHDAAESILPDVSAPFKQLLPDLRKLEHDLDVSIRSTFGLPAEKTQEATKADWLALFIEAAQIIPERGADFVDPYDLRKEALALRESGIAIRCFTWQQAKVEWLKVFEDIRHV